MTIFEINLFWLTIAPSYYWLMYVLAFVSWYYYIKYKKILSENQLDSLVTYVFFWMILWWRFGYILFYDLPYYLNNILDIFKVWNWWMSFHWWFLWVVLAVIIFCKKNKLSFWMLIDELAVITTAWLFFWRIWNYLNKELLGFANYNWFLSVSKWWINYFPSPLLEALLEWIVLWIILFFINKHKKYFWKTSAFFLIWYWTFRIIVEIFFRTPDPQLWYFLNFLTMGTILSIPMIILWFILIAILSKKNIINKN